MKSRLFVILISILFATAGVSPADMGYFATIAQNPVPAGIPGWHSTIEMTAEDVVIEVLESGRAGITADFLFTNNGDAESLIMYFPVSVMTPQISHLWNLTQTTPLLDSPAVTVNGTSAEVYPLLRGRWSPQRNELTWKDVLKLSTPLTDGEPDTNAAFFYMLHPSCWESLTMDFVSPLDIPDRLVMMADGFMAAWTVDFDAGEQILVEYCMEYRMSGDREEHVYTIFYPLYTGAGWAGSIGKGRISVIRGELFPWDTLIDWTSLSMTEGVEVQNLELDPFTEFSDLLTWEKTRLSQLTGNTYYRALVWEFSDFEPAITPSVWQAFYPFPEGSDSIWLASTEPDGETVEWASALRVRFSGPGTDLQDLQ